MNLGDILKEAHKQFERCLLLVNKSDLSTSLGNLNEMFLAMEKFDRVELQKEVNKNFFLFIEVFQFSLLARDPVWERTPKLYAVIGEVINREREVEVVFRRKVQENKLGRLLEFT